VAKGPLPTLIIVATGLLHEDGRGPEKALRDLDPAWLARVHAVNAIGPVMVAKHFLPLMPRTGRAVLPRYPQGWGRSRTIGWAVGMAIARQRRR
jgi:NAD(P)-dependent dehydrogenase (short-subunit alcohol dehydrogenase family)